MHYLEQSVFILMLIGAFYFFFRRLHIIYKIVQTGKKSTELVDAKKAIYNLFLLAFGQKKMFNKPVVALLHLMIYTGFIVLNIELAEILLDGITGSHRVLFSVLGTYYTGIINLMEWFAVLVLISCVVFLIRRNLVKVNRLNSQELSGWPSNDANIILIAEIFIVLMMMTMNGADTLLQLRNATVYSSTATGNFHFSRHLHPLLDKLPTSFLIIVERLSWWLHISGILSFLAYITHSKHLHIFLSFPNAYFSRQGNSGKLQNMPLVQQEVKAVFDPENAQKTIDNTVSGSFGVRDIPDMSRLQLLNAFSCTECGRCAEVCPATQTGKKLSPRKIMMSTRDRAEDWGKMMTGESKDFSDGKSLLSDYITEEEIHACTTCNACAEACPINISPVEIIIDLRRYLVMEKGISPREWTVMFSNTENNYATWAFNPEERSKWTNELG